MNHGLEQANRRLYPLTLTAPSNDFMKWANSVGLSQPHLRTTLPFETPFPPSVPSKPEYQGNP